MNKKVLAVAVGATLAAAPLLSAQAAKVKVYGKALVEVVDINSDTGATPDERQYGDSNGRSRWGIKASQDLGNGMKAIANFEFKLDPANNDDESNRQQWVGLQGGFGTLKFGRDHSAYKTCGGVKWDPYTATFLQARRNGGMSGDSFGHNGFRNDLIGYSTPKGLGGFRANLQYSLDESSDDGDYHVCGGWKGGPLEIIVAANNDDSKDVQNAKVGARYKSGGLTAFVQYEDTENSGSIRPNGNNIGTLGEGNFLLVGVGYKFGNNLLHGNIGGFDADAGGNDVDYLAIGITHFFDKKTRVYAGYTNVDYENVDDVDMVGAGIRFDF